MWTASHTLFQPGTWRVSGYYLSANQERIEVTGSFFVTRKTHVWTTQSRLTLHQAEPQAYANDCFIAAFAKGRKVTSWRSQHSLFGELTGTFTLVEDSVLSSFSSIDGRYSGTESLLRVFAEEYQSRGAVLRSGRRVASWRVELFKT